MLHLQKCKLSIETVACESEELDFEMNENVGLSKQNKHRDME